MHLSELHSRDMEVSLLKAKLKRAELTSKAIWEYRDYIAEIKEFIGLEELTGASEEWNELEYDIQKRLYTAPLYGGPFTTKERAIIRDFWKIEESYL